MGLSAKKTKEEVVTAVNKAVEGASHVKAEVASKKEHVKDATALAPTLNAAVTEKDVREKQPAIQIGDKDGHNYVRPVKAEEKEAKSVDAPEL